MEVVRGAGGEIPEVVGTRRWMLVVEVDGEEEGRSGGGVGADSAIVE